MIFHGCRVLDRVSGSVAHGVTDLSPYVSNPRYEVQFSTGLVDNVGKEIYDGDLTSDSRGELWEIGSTFVASCRDGYRERYGTDFDRHARTCAVVERGNRAG